MIQSSYFLSFFLKLLRFTNTAKEDDIVKDNGNQSRYKDKKNF